MSHDRGLGAAVSAYVRSVGPGQKVVVHLTLQESALRLPGEHEVVLFRVLQAVVQDVRRAEGAQNLWVDLDVDPPSARLRVEHDRPGSDPALLDLGALAPLVDAMGGALRVSAGHQETGVRVDVQLLGGTDERQRPTDR